MLQIVFYLSFAFAPDFFIIKKTIKTIQINTIHEPKILEIEVTLQRFLKKPRFMVEIIYTGNLHHLPL